MSGQTPSSVAKIRLTDIFIERPVLALVVSLLILLLGVQAIATLSIREFPLIENPRITVRTSYPGASPESVRSFITTPVQQALASAEGIDTISSTSNQGFSEVTLTLRLGANQDRAITDVISKVSEVRYLLPREAFDPVVSRNPEGQGLMYIDFASDVMTPSQITEILLRQVQPALQSVTGVGSANILGAKAFAMRVWLNPDRMAALNVTATDVRTALLTNNVTAAPGEVKGDFIQATVDVKTDLSTEDDFRTLAVATRNGIIVRLADVARVELGPQDTESSTFATGKRAVFIEINTVPGGNALTVLPAVRAKIEELKKILPPQLRTQVSWDASGYIRGAIIEVIKTVLEAALIVVIVVYLFLGNARATLIPVVTIPLSLIGVLSVMQAMGYSINLLTLLALVLAIGMVVDDAIVVAENIARHIEEGMPPRMAALQGAREIALPVIGMTITLSAVYAPIAFIGGLTGQLFKEFALTLAAAVLISGVVALTLSPMMSAYILKPNKDTGGREKRFALWLETKFDQLKQGYQRRLEGALGYRKITLAIGLLMILSCFMFYTTTRKELAPNEDNGFIFLLTDAPEWTNIDYVDSYVEKYHDIFKKYPEYEASFLVTPTPSLGFGGFIMKPWDQRDRGPKDLLPLLAKDFSQVTGVNIQAVQSPSLPIPGGGNFPVEFVVQSLGDYKDLQKAVDQLQQEAQKSGLFLFTTASLTTDKPQIDINIDRQKAAQLGVSMADISDTLSTLLGGNYVNLFEMDGRSYRVIPQVERQYRLSPQLLGQYYVRASSSKLLPLSTFVSLSQSVKPNALTTFQQLNSATISGVPFPGRTVGDALAFLEKTTAEKLPKSFSYDYAGESRQFKKEGNQLTITFGFAMLLIFLVLAAQFESFRDPLIILVSVPMSLAGALMALNIGSGFNLDGFSLNIYSQIGLVTLAGLIAKHGILMVDFANHLQTEKNISKQQAIVEAASIRLRPILMTTAAIVSGVLPLLVASGPGATARFSIGIVIAAGMTIGTLFTLFVLPAVYVLLAKDHRPLAKPAPSLALRPALQVAAE
jgi:multidrug efflux pump